MSNGLNKNTGEFEINLTEVLELIHGYQYETEPTDKIDGALFLKALQYLDFYFHEIEKLNAEHEELKYAVKLHLEKENK